MTECIKLCASHKYNDKRVAYLGLMILVDESEEILMLMTNCLKQDLHSEEVQIVSLALNVLGNIASAEMVRDLMPEIEIHLHSSNPYIRKKAVLAAVRAVRKLGPEETSDILKATPAVFDVRSSAVHTAGSVLVSSLCKQDTANCSQLQIQMTPVLIHVLRDHLEAKRGQNVPGGNPDTVIRGVRNPFLQVKFISTLRVLAEVGGMPGELLVEVCEMLRDVASRIDCAKLVGCAVLYECIRTIISLDTPEDLRALAVTILGRFLVHKEATVRYIALQELTRIVDVDGPHVLSHIVGYKDKVLSGLHEADPSIRKRAVELICRITDASNVVEMVKELLGYIEKGSLSEDVEDACWKIFALLEDFGPSDEWKVEIFVKTLSLADVHMPEELITSFIAMVSANPQIQAHAAHALFNEALVAKQRDGKSLGTGDIFDSASSRQGNESMGEKENLPRGRRKPRLERVAVYILGEYAETIPHVGLEIPQVLDAFENILSESEVVDEPWMNLDGAELSAENRILVEATLTGLVKFACRAMGNPKSSERSSGQQVLAITQGKDDSGLNALLGLPAPPPKADAVLDSGLGTDLLAGMGLGDENLGISLVPSVQSLVPLENRDSSALIALDSNAEDFDSNPLVSRVQRILSVRARSPEVEVQQRACEYLTLLSQEFHPVLAHTMAPMPRLDFETIQRKAKQRQHLRSGNTVSTNKNGSDLLIDLLEDSTNGGAPLALPSTTGTELLALSPTDPTPTNGLSLEDILGGGLVGQPGPTPNADVNVSTIQSEESKIGMMDTVPNPTAPEVENKEVTQGADPAVGSGAFRTITVFESKSLSVVAAFNKENAEDPSATRADITFTNKSSQLMKDFVFLAAVPKYIKLQMQPASSSEIVIGGQAMQIINMINSLHGERPIQMRYRIEYKQDGLEELIRHQGVASGLEGL